MKKYFLTLLSAFALLFNINGLILTNGPEANLTAPATLNVGWQYCVGAATAIGPNLFCQVKHVPVTGFMLNGVAYSVVKVIEPADWDIRFVVVDKTITNYAKLYICPTNYPDLNKGYIVGWGVPRGLPAGANSWWWGNEEFPRRKRWAETDSVKFYSSGYFIWKTSQAGSGNGDSGGGVFTDKGEFIGPIKFGDNPVTVGVYESGGLIASEFMSYIKDYLPKPEPIVVSSNVVNYLPVNVRTNVKIFTGPSSSKSVSSNSISLPKPRTARNYP